jgi:Arc/MetJ-type ribon-helix-helix transcriptional regulator
MTEKTFQITLSGDALAWLEAEIRDGTYRDESEMLQALVQRDLDALGALILEGEASGISPRSGEEILAGLKRRRNNAA